MFVNMKTLRQLYQLIRPYRGRVLLVTLFLLGTTAIEMALPTIIQKVIDVGLLAGQTQFLIFSALLVAGLGLIKMFLSQRQTFLTRWISQKTAFDLRNQLYDHIQRLSFSYHDHAQSGQLISRCIEDVSSVQNFTGTGFTTLAQVVLLLVGITILLFSENPRLALISMLPLVPLALLTTSFGRRIGKLFYEVDKAVGDLSSRLQENVVGVHVVRAFARERYEIDRFGRANRHLFNVRVKTMREFAKIIPSSNFLVALSTILILWFGGQMVINNQLTLGELVAFNSYVLLLALPTQQLAWLVNQAGEASAGLRRAYEVLQLEPEIQSPPDPIILPKLKGKVEFHDVSFRYSGEKKPALHHVDLEVEPNQVIALIGATGSGKTSLVNLIPRFYDVSQGAVLIDGYDVRQVELTSLRQQIGIVLQTTLLFSASVRENLAYGKPDLSLDEIIAAAKVAQAHEFIREMPEGYDTVVGERGVTLSGGQRQRVAIARALLMDPRILILDDSTSSVDTQTEKRIQQALYHLMEGRTTFVIAQRLSTVQRADLILVMDQGKIIERGRHNELLAQDGVYRQIYNLQLRQQELVE
jgi:ATP-binding cassette subfamily B multidrug efflux pump